MIDVCLLGTGGMLPLPQRALTSLYVRHNGHVLLIDCGEGTQTAIRSVGLRFKPIEAILLTHFHAAHIAGLPGLLLTIGNQGRTEPLTIYGPTRLAETVDALRVIAPEIPYEIEYRELHTNEPTRFSCIGLEVDSIPLAHRVPCLGYCFTLLRKGKFNAKIAQEKGIPVSLWSRLQRGEAAGGFVPEDVLGSPRRGLSILYATDTRPVPVIAEYGKDADLLILEGIFGEKKKQERAELTCHMMMQEAAEIACCANAKELWLTHFSPAVPHPEEFSDEMRAIFSNTVVGRDGMFRTLRFDQ